MNNNIKQINNKHIVIYVIFCFFFLISSSFCENLNQQELEVDKARKEYFEGMKFWEKQDYNSALKHFEIAADIDKNNEKYCSNAGICSSYLGKKQVAVNWFKKAIEIAVKSKNYTKIEQYNDQISAIINVWPDWAQSKLDELNKLPPSQQKRADYQKWFELAEKSNQFIEIQELDKALEVLFSSLALVKHSFGKNNILYGKNLFSIAQAYHENGDYEKAAEFYLNSFEIYKEILGSGHPETINALKYLAMLYEENKDYIKAKDIYNQCLSLCIKELGENYYQTLEIMYLLSQINYQLNDIEHSIELLKKCLSIHIILYGKNHPDTITCMEDMAILYKNKSKLIEAESLFKDIINIKENTLGTDHPETIKSIYETSELYLNMAQYNKSEEFINRALEAYKKKFGDNSIEAFECLTILASIYEKKGEYNDAFKLFNEIYLFDLKKFGEKHPNTITDLSNLASIKRRLGRLREAEIDFIHIADLCKEVFGKNYEAAINANNNIALVYEEQGLYEKAEPIYKESLKLSEEILGKKHPSTLALMNNLAMLYESQGLFIKAESLYKETIDLNKQIYGKEHTKTIASINNLAYLYMIDKKYADSVKLFEEVWNIWSQTLGKKHQNTLKACNNLARSYLSLNKIDQAMPLFKEAFETRKEIFGLNHIDTIRSLNDMGVLYLKQKKFQDALLYFKQAIDIEEGFLGKYHPYTFETLNNLSSLYENISDFDSVFKTRKKIFQRRNVFFDRVLWLTGENARQGYISLHKNEQDKYLEILVKINSEKTAKEAMIVSLKRKGLLLKISSEIQNIIKMLDKPEIRDLSNELLEKKKHLASLTLSGPVDISAKDFFLKVKSLEENIEDIQAEIGRKSVLFKKSIQAVSPDDIMKVLAKNEAMIDFLIYTNNQNVKQLIAVVMNKNSQKINIVNYGRLKNISDIVKYYREVIQDEDSEQEDINEIGMELYNILWKPLLESINSITSIYLIPDGILNIAPFDAIYDPEGHYLIQKYEIKILSSGRDILNRLTQVSNGDYIIFAGPDYNSDYLQKNKIILDINNKRNLDIGNGLRLGSFGLRSLSFDPLPGAEKEGKEIEAICQSLKKTILFSKEKALESQLRKLNEAPQILHIATHGFFLKSQDNLVKRLIKLQRSSDSACQIPPPGDNPLLRAGLAFAGINKNANYLGEIDTDNDGVLTALEVLGLELSGTGLIVLSACETGLGEVHEGEGVYGLRRAFQEAGASMIINSLWEVSDQGTQALMTNLYKKLLSGTPIRKAFRQTQLDMIKSNRWQHPYIWSAFFMVGI